MYTILSKTKIEGIKELAFECDEHYKDFESSNIEMVAFNRQKHALFIEFKSGREYIYEEVTIEAFERFMGSSSLGEGFGEHIKDNFNLSGSIIAYKVKWTNILG